MQMRGKKLIILSVLGWITFALVIPKFTGFGIIKDSADQTNYLPMTATIFAVFGSAMGLCGLDRLSKWHTILIKLLAAFLIIPASAFFIINLVVYSFELQSNIQPFSILAAVIYAISLGLGVLIVSKLRNPLNIFKRLGN